MVVKTLDLPVLGTELSPFTDVGMNMDPSDPNYPDRYVAVCFIHGIIEGTTSTTFAPYVKMSRAQLITMVGRAADLPAPPADYAPPFGDFSTEHYPWARKAAYAGLLGSLLGIGPGYDFWAFASRGEVAQMLHNLDVISLASQPKP
jgi:hypothetical protein